MTVKRRKQPRGRGTARRCLAVLGGAIVALTGYASRAQSLDELMNGAEHSQRLQEMEQAADNGDWARARSLQAQDALATAVDEMRNELAEFAVFTGHHPNPQTNYDPYRHQRNYNYGLANQATYTVPLGPIAFRYNGANAVLSESILIDSFNNLDIKVLGVATGWGPRADADLPSTFDLAKGTLFRSVNANGTQTDPCSNATNGTIIDVAYSYRFRYVGADGRSRQFTNFDAEQVWSKMANACTTVDTGVRPTKYSSDDGAWLLDVSDPCKPLVFHDGVMEEMEGMEDWYVTILEDPTGQSHYMDPGGTSCPNSGAFVRRVVNANGNVTTYSWNNFPSQRVIVDPRGRTTTLNYNLNRRLTQVQTLGPGGVPLTYTVNWSTKTADLAATFPDITCTNFSGQPASCGSNTYDNVDSIVMADGRSYVFTYGPFGNLTRAVDPDGAVHVWNYGGSADSDYARAAALLAAPFAPDNMQRRGVLDDTVYPNGDGPGQPGLKTTWNFSSVDKCTYDASGNRTASSPACCQMVFASKTSPDGVTHKTASCVGPIAIDGRQPAGMQVVGRSFPHGRILGEEAWPPGATAPSSATYFGDLNTGTHYYNAISLTELNSVIPSIVFLNPAREVRIRDGVQTTKTFSYEPNSGNVVSECLWVGPGIATDCATGNGATKLSQTDTAYLHSVAYDARHLMNLKKTVTIKDPLGAIVSRTDTGYDEYPLVASGAPNLDTSVGTARGNPTSTTAYVTPATLVGPVRRNTFYYDNGVIQRTQNPLDAAAGRNTTQVTANFGKCSATNATLATTVTNALGHTRVSVVDCYSDRQLSTTNANAAVTCAQIDGLSRTVETATSGDTLSALPLCTSASTSPAGCYVRDTAACPASGTALGNGGSGPTTWTEYFVFGMGGVGYNQARTVSHEKDGSPSGKITKTFFDSLGRPIGACAGIDNTTSAGAGTNNESCSFTAFDAMGRVFKAYSPFYATSQATAVAPASGQYTQTCYDALGRVTAAGLVWGGTWACGSSPPATSQVTSFGYGASGNNWLMTTTDPKGNQSQVLTNVLGQMIESDQYLCATSPCSTSSGKKLPTTMRYDVVGRLLSSTDPPGNVLSYVYDGLGRKTRMSDPDLGTWTYDYDANGNLIRQIDAKQQTTLLYYDVLDRPTVKDLPPTGPGREDELNTYDGVLPTCAPMPCAAWSAGSTALCCDDHNPATTDSCNPETVTCNSTAAPFPGVCVPGTTRNVACPGPGTETDTCDGTGQWVAGTCLCTPGATRTVACGNCGTETDTCNSSGLWSAGVCSAQGVCSPGSTRTLACGNCGSETDTCSASCQWTAGTCNAQGICTPGATRTSACGNCGSETDTCSTTCQWTAGTCSGQGVCAPGSTRSLACGNCGTETDTCATTCQWTAGTCNGQGVCAPGTTRSLSCGNCGTETDTCASTCSWTTGSCTGQGVCAAGTTQSLACADSMGDPGTQTNTCGSTCQWSSGVCVVCTPGATQACDTTGVCDTCSGLCAYGSQTCTASGTWGTCSGAKCSLTGGCTTRICLEQ